MSASAAGKITVLIADDHPVVRQGLRVLLSLHPDIEVVGEAGDGAEAVELAAAVAPDVILLDLKLPGLDGLGVLAELRDRNLPARVLVLTSVADSASVTVAMRGGAAGFLTRTRWSGRSARCTTGTRSWRRRRRARWCGPGTGPPRSAASTR